MRSITAAEWARSAAAAVVGLGLRLAQQLEVADDRGQRRAQLVRDEGEELVLQALGLALGGDVAQDDERAVHPVGVLVEPGDVARQDAPVGQGELVARRLRARGGRHDAGLPQLRHGGAQRLVGDRQPPVGAEEPDGVGGRVEDGARQAQPRAALAQRDRLGQRGGGLVGQVRRELLLGLRPRVAGQAGQAQHAEDLVALHERDVELVADGDGQAVGADPQPALGEVGRDGAPLGRRPAGEADARLQALGQVLAAQAARDGGREGVVEAGVAREDRPDVGADGVGHAGQDEVGQRGEPRLRRHRLAEGLRLRDAALLVLELADERSSSRRWPVELAVLALEPPPPRPRARRGPPGAHRPWR